MLDIAGEQPDTELLLQKHFTALLSSVWKMTSRVDRLKNLTSSRNGIYFGGRFFTPGNQISHSIRDPGERLKFTNLGQSSRLLAAALNDVGSRKQDDKASPSNHSKDVSANAERLEITLEFQGERDETLASLPSILHLSIIGSDPPSVSEDEGEDHFKTSNHVAENRFR